MKFISWNVNGIRACVQKGFMDVFNELDADIFCIQEQNMQIRGRDLISGLPKTIEISSAEVRDALNEPINSIVDAIKSTLEKTPPELASDIMENGIMLTGGGALLRGLDKLVKQETGMPVQIAENPLDCVALGTGKSVEDQEIFEKVLMMNARK